MHIVRPSAALVPSFSFTPKNVVVIWVNYFVVPGSQPPRELRRNWLQARRR